MQISAQTIKELREKTGAGVIDCKNALQEASGDLEKACSILIQRGIKIAEKKSDRAVASGLIETYLHMGKIGVMLEVNCETDFVAKTDEFKNLAHDLALQVAAMAPAFITKEELKADSTDDPKAVCLLEQAFIKDPSKTIQELVTETVAKVGENIKIRRFTRFQLGC